MSNTIMFLLVMKHKVKWHSFSSWCEWFVQPVGTVHPIEQQTEDGERLLKYHCETSKMQKAYLRSYSLCSPQMLFSQKESIPPEVNLSCWPMSGEALPLTLIVGATPAPCKQARKCYPPRISQQNKEQRASKKMKEPADPQQLCQEDVWHRVLNRVE